MTNERFDSIGPEKIIQLYDPKSGMKGILVVDNTRRGPGKGGTRMSLSVSIEEVSRLARAMTLKNAMADLPFGGAKSGIIVDSKALTKEKKAELVTAFAHALKQVSPSIYVGAPDIAMAEEEMRIMAKILGNKGVTGKPKDIGGIPHELGSTGFGVYHSTKVAAAHIHLPLQGARIAVEGFGNVGSFAAKFLGEEGTILVAASDSKGAIYNKEGLDVEELIQLKAQGKSVTDYDDGERIDDIMTIDCDVLIPAAQADVINDNNKDDVKAKIIVEGANIPMSEEIEEEFHRKGILVIPDFVANAGGVISSYVEYIGGKEHEVFPLVEKKITNNTRMVLEKSKQHNTSPRKAAMHIALERLK